MPEGWNVLSGNTSLTGQEQDKHGTSTNPNRDELVTDDVNIQKIVSVLAERQLSVREIMELMGLKGRDNFLRLYLRPAIDEGYVLPVFPNKPRHPGQKYLLTVKGKALYNEFIKK